MMEESFTFFKMEIKSFKEIFNEIESEDSDILEEFKKIYSKHNKKINDTQHYESLYEHIMLVKKKFIKILKENGLEKIYNNIIKNLVLLEKKEYSFEEKINDIKKTIVEAVLYHDIGKLSPYFQESIFKENIFRDHTFHSEPSYLFLILKNFEKIKKYDFISFLKWSIYYSVLYHHGNLEKFSYQNFFKIKEHLKKENIKEILEKTKEKYHFLEKIFNNYQDFLSFKLKKIAKKKEEIDDILYKSNGELFFLIKLFYSHLVISDYYATAKYTFGINLNVKSIDENFLNKIENSFNTSKSYNKLLSSWNIKKVEECNNIFDIRMNLLKQASENIKKSLAENKRIFMLNVPTGGGKTNISLKLALDILKYDKDIKRIFWVFPFINIIEQNYKVIKSTYELEDNDISKVHSTEIFLDKKSNLETEEDKKDLFELFLDYNFLNNKINVISSINFFNTIIKGKKNNRYKSIYYPNSVVIIDEIQSIPVEYLDLFYNILDQISKVYNIYFIVMSATLPDLNIFLESKIPHLIENYQEYFNSEIFKRNKIEINKDTIFTIEALSEKVIELKSKEEYKKILVVVNTISSSIKLFEKLKLRDYENKIFLLNSTLNVFEKNKIIDRIKEEESCILISTQSVEAGVDLDFDIAIRDYGPLDSLEQISGRVNRECNPEKKNSKVEVIIVKENNREEYLKVYGEENPKIKVQRKDYPYREYNIHKYEKEILENKEFFKYYSEIKVYLKSKEIKENKDGLLILFLKSLEIEKLSKINIIRKQPAVELFLEYPIKINEKISRIVTYLVEKDKRTITFLDENTILPNIKIIKEYMKNIIKSRTFLDMAEIKNIQSFLSYFTISFLVYSKNNEILLLEKLNKRGIINEDYILEEEYKNVIIKKYEYDGEEFHYFDLKIISDILNETYKDEGYLI